MRISPRSLVVVLSSGLLLVCPGPSVRGGEPGSGAEVWAEFARSGEATKGPAIANARILLAALAGLDAPGDPAPRADDLVGLVVDVAEAVGGVPDARRAWAAIVAPVLLQPGLGLDGPRRARVGGLLREAGEPDPAAIPQRWRTAPLLGADRANDLAVQRRAAALGVVTFVAIPGGAADMIALHERLDHLLWTWPGHLGEEAVCRLVADVATALRGLQVPRDEWCARGVPILLQVGRQRPELVGPGAAPAFWEANRELVRDWLRRVPAVGGNERSLGALWFEDAPGRAVDNGSGFLAPDLDSPAGYEPAGDHPLVLNLLVDTVRARLRSAPFAADRALGHYLRWLVNDRARRSPPAAAAVAAFLYRALEPPPDLFAIAADASSWRDPAATGQAGFLREAYLAIAERFDAHHDDARAWGQAVPALFLGNPALAAPELGPGPGALGALRAAGKLRLLRAWELLRGGSTACPGPGAGPRASRPRGPPCRRGSWKTTLRSTPTPIPPTRIPRRSARSSTWPAPRGATPPPARTSRSTPGPRRGSSTCPTASPRGRWRRTRGGATGSPRCRPRRSASPSSAPARPARSPRRPDVGRYADVRPLGRAPRPRLVRRPAAAGRRRAHRRARRLARAPGTRARRRPPRDDRGGLLARHPRRCAGRAVPGGAGEGVRVRPAGRPAVLRGVRPARVRGHLRRGPTRGPPPRRGAARRGSCRGSSPQTWAAARTTRSWT